VAAENYRRAIEVAAELIDSHHTPLGPRCYALQALAECFRKLGQHEDRLESLARLSKISPRSASLYVMPGLVVLVPSSPFFNESYKQTEKTREILKRICKAPIPKPTLSASEVAFFKIPPRAQVEEIVYNDTWLTAFSSPVETLQVCNDMTPKCFTLWEQLCLANMLKQSDSNMELFKMAFKELESFSLKAENYSMKGLISCILLDGGLSSVCCPVDTQSKWLKNNMFLQKAHAANMQKFSAASLKCLMDLPTDKPFHLPRAVAYRALNDKSSFWSRKTFEWTQPCHADRFIISSERDMSLIESTCQVALVKLLRAMYSKVESSSGLSLGHYTISTPSGAILVTKERARCCVERFFDDYLDDHLGDSWIKNLKNSTVFSKDETELLLAISDREFSNL
ncbi:tetratricopeptide repeat protein, partial [Candidatus Similichlamydia laticola]|uniref:tetratricopeptide repeat protein n=1 Tax=Candidatus Similichlamydia laticola TaxID=2170265 RepID=UPI0015F08869